jgi:hypothetical protein
MKLHEIRVGETASDVRLTGVVERVGSPKSFEVFFEYPVEFKSFLLGDAADPFVPTLLVPSMATGEDLEIDPPISDRLRRKLDRAQDILSTWHPSLRRVGVISRSEPRPREGSGSGVGAFFSGGADSFFTLLEPRGHRDDEPEISHLLFIKGLETPLEKSKGIEQSQRRAQEVAKATGKTLIPGLTNLRSHFDVDYEHIYHGPALISAALALSEGLKSAILSSSDTYAELIPWGSHPLLDELWSTERMEILHNGGAFSRAEKLRSVVVKSPLAMEYLRVCVRNDGGPYNCGRCKKCVRTMVMLEMLGVLSEARTFPDRLPENYGAALLEDLDQFLGEIRDLGLKTGLRPKLTKQIIGIIRRRRRRRALRTFLENAPILDRILPPLLRYRERLWG